MRRGGASTTRSSSCAPTAASWPRLQSWSMPARIRPVIDQVFAFDESPAALARVASGRARGKVTPPPWLYRLRRPDRRRHRRLPERRHRSRLRPAAPATTTTACTTSASTPRRDPTPAAAPAACCDEPRGDQRPSCTPAAPRERCRARTPRGDQELDVHGVSVIEVARAGGTWAYSRTPPSTAASHATEMSSPARRRQPAPEDEVSRPTARTPAAPSTTAPTATRPGAPT